TATNLWSLVRQRGEASIEFYVTAEDVPGENAILLHAPKSLLNAHPSGRPSATTHFYRVVLEDGRRLHAKGIWLEDERWTVYQIGSSNFTIAGTGTGNAPNLEANLVYIVDSTRDAKAKKLLQTTFPEGVYVDLDGDVRWKPLAGEGVDTVGEEILLPDSF